MTSAEFAARYKLLKRITERGVRSYNAQTSGGRPVMVHYFDDGVSGAQQPLVARMRNLDAADRAKVVEAVEVDGIPVLVTQFLPGFTTLEDWLASRVPPAPASFSAVFRTTQPPQTPTAPPVAPAAPAAPPSAIDPFAAPTQLMQSPVVQSPPSPQQSTVSPPPPAASPESRPPAGEFTRMFSATPDVPAVPAEAAGRTPAEAPRAPGAPTPPPAPQAQTPPLPRAEPGEFTKLFQSPAPRDDAPMFGLPPAAPPRHQSPFAAPPPTPATPPVAPAPHRPAAGTSLPPVGASRIFDAPVAPHEPARELPGDRIVPLSGAGSPPQSVTGIMGARHAEPSAPPPSDLFAFGFANPAPVSPSAPGAPAPAGPGAVFPNSIIQPPIIQPPVVQPPVFQAPVIQPPVVHAPIIPAPVIPSPVLPPAPAAPILAAPSVAAAAGAAITLGVAAGSAPPAPNAPAGAPSEFTRVLKGVAAPAAAAAVVTGAAIAAQKKKDQQAGRKGPSIVPLVVGLNLLVIAAIGLILYFVLAG